MNKYLVLLSIRDRDSSGKNFKLLSHRGGKNIKKKTIKKYVTASFFFFWFHYYYNTNLRRKLRRKHKQAIVNTRYSSAQQSYCKYYNDDDDDEFNSRFVYFKSENCLRHQVEWKKQKTRWKIGDNDLLCTHVRSEIKNKII